LYLGGIQASSLIPFPALAAPADKTASTSSVSVAGFGGLGLSDTMLAALERAAYLEPTPVQAGIIPRALAGVDVLGQARTGTGKTAAFAIPILERLKSSRKATPPQALVLVPTRELAVQVRDEFEKLAHGRRAACVPIYGGKPIRGQLAKLERGADVVVGTPGRVLDHLARGSLDLRAVRTVVLDEADRMLDIGFRPDIEKILRRCPKERQTLLLSATVAPPVERLAQKYMHEPEVMDFSPKTMAVETIEQFYFTVDQERKFDLLVHLLKRDQPEQAIIFCRTKRGTERVFRRLSKHFSAVDMMHGDMVQGARDRVMKAFRAGQVRLLVATDVVGRGIDVSSISHIINYDIPQSSDDYVHRVGRTGRMGREGVAYTFVTTEEGGELTRIEMLINRLLKRDEIPGFAAVASLAAAGDTPAPAAAEPPGGETGEGSSPPPRPLPPGRRPPKRHRRAL
jgi:ATP-dependent RNA helicase DeaD